MKQPLTLALCLFFLVPRLPAADEAPLTTASGSELYGQFCASCHGASGRGDGPVAAALKGPVPDLTRIGARQGGFPAERVRDMIDGRAMVPAHGTREMPVWGYELEARVPGNMPGRATAQRMTERLVDYLKSIQEPSTR